MTYHKPKPKTKFGFKSLNRPTPIWARRIVGITLLVTTAIAGWVAGTNVIDQAAKLEWVLVLKIIDPLLLGISKFIGIDTNPRRHG
jgi:hypothetical protein